MLKLFSNIDFTNVKTCLCLFENYVKNDVNIFGDPTKDRINNYKEILALKKYVIDNNGIIHFYVFNKADELYVNNIILEIYNIYCKCDKKLHNRIRKNMRVYLYSKNWEVNNIVAAIKNNMVQCKMNNYDYIIQNPPYSGSTHLEFLKKGLEMIQKSKGKMTIIEPATWLINVRKNGKAKKYDEIKKMIEGHISKVVVENLNEEFGIEIYTPLSITYIDMSQNFDHIEFICCGDKKYVSSLYDCNMVGEYAKIWGIFNKVQKYGDMMNDHVYNEKKSKVDENTWYCKFLQIIARVGCSDPRWSDIWFNNGMYTAYFYPSFDNREQITQNTIKSLKSGYTYDNPVYSDKPADCLYDTKEHLENWKHFVFNNKLPLFLNICLTIDQHNNSLDFVPWLVDRQYTDEEINEHFQFTAEEVKLIDKTLKKFERHSPWFKRYMCGKDSVSDEEVQKFIDSL
ncbi:MAG: hypothetical protein [Wendovervirus sonii]|uniref:Site-specific DNA-methyltransferase (adenine-specific) n=1 Tax=phage Lak_Megaphage_Sonny TaxID=3109229 RepID=A0ABZ0Z256_9CAUD|nr:MAG: hypothetical protein [phage Lak_Megaphage_Sonny]